MRPTAAQMPVCCMRKSEIGVGLLVLCDRVKDVCNVGLLLMPGCRAELLTVQSEAACGSVKSSCRCRSDIVATLQHALLVGDTRHENADMRDAIFFRRFSRSEGHRLLKTERQVAPFWLRWSRRRAPPLSRRCRDCRACRCQQHVVSSDQACI